VRDDLWVGEKGLLDCKKGERGGGTVPNARGKRGATDFFFTKTRRETC